ncbi:hypothetical protein SLS56_000324 [Neofusicoccum ribis]|uniref:Protein kinase domain-containing protein n=1 Tax=Neofusicoccum ribis TaxID=45134 RepID=A0ABR3TEU8_9PEZI
MSDQDLPFTLDEIENILNDMQHIPKFLEKQWRVTTPFAELSVAPDAAQGGSRPVERYFKEVGKLGPDGSGQVDHVIDQSNTQHYARKRINLGLGARSKAQRQRLENEMQVLRRISHAHLISYVASYVDSRTMGILISPVADMNLAAFLEIQGMSQEQRSLLRTFFGCLSSALAYLHKAGVRHKDIKPANVLIKSSTVYLADFGIAGPTQQRSTNSLLSIPDFTPQYAAPEVANDEAYEVSNGQLINRQSQKLAPPLHDIPERDERDSIRVTQDQRSSVSSATGLHLEWDSYYSEEEDPPNQSIDIGRFLENLPWSKFPEESDMPQVDVDIGLRSINFIDTGAVQQVHSQLSRYCDQFASSASTDMMRLLVSSPKVCLILKHIKRGDLLQHFIISKQTDEGLPFSHRQLYELFQDKDIATKFERVQYRSLIRDLDPDDITRFADKEIIPFKKIRDLGSGGWAKVDCTRNVVSGMVVARKLFTATSLSSKDERKFRESFEKQIASLKRLSGHQHVVQYVGAYQSSKSLGLLMSPVAECDFHSFLANPEIIENEDTANFITRAFGCLTSALAFMHGHNIRHKDIKSENILLDCSGTAPNFLFTDFGIANDFSQTKESMTRGPRLQGTLRYCAPEVAKLRERATRSDVFSLGCVFVEAVTVLAGRPLRELYESLNEDYIFHESLPEIRRCLHLLSTTDDEQVAKVLLWCGIMLEEQPEKRPYASQLLNTIAHDTKGQDGLRTHFFCDFCLAELRLKQMITVDICNDSGATTDDFLGESECKPCVAFYTEDSKLTLPVLIMESPATEVSWKPINPITMQYTFETFADVMRRLHTLSLAFKLRNEESPGRVQEIKLSFEMLRLLNWGQVLQLHTKRAIPGSDLAENHRTIVNILVQTKTLIEPFFQVSSGEPAGASETTSLELQFEGTSAAKFDQRQPYFPTSADKFLKEVLAVQSPVMHPQIDIDRLAKTIRWHDLQKLLTELSQKNKDLRKFVSQSSRGILRDRDEETNLELLQLCDTFQELSALVEAVKPALLPSQLDDAGHWTLPETTGDASKGSPGVWNRKALARFARFKAINTRISRGEPKDASITDVELHRAQLMHNESWNQDSDLSGFSERTQTFFRTPKGVSIPVWIEWSDYEPTRFDGKPDPLVVSRISELAALLWDPHKPREFRVPRCLGYFSDIDPETGEDHCRFGRVFEAPAGKHGSVQPVSLFELYSDTQIPQKPERLSLALAVSRCVLYLHAANWLHKGLNSDSTIFFRHHSGRIDFSSPFLSGFAYARPAQNDDMTVKPPENSFLDLYRHPLVLRDRDRPFKKFHDLYSLGIILIEIANWRPINRILGIDKRSLKPSTVMRVRQRLLDEQEPLRTIHLSLGSRKDPDERTPVVAAELQSAFYNTVIKELQEISTTSA